MANPFTDSTRTLFIGNPDTALGWSAEKGWVCPSNDHVDLYSEGEALIIGVPPEKAPPAGEKWQWIEYHA